MKVVAVIVGILVTLGVLLAGGVWLMGHLSQDIEATSSVNSKQVDSLDKEIQKRHEDTREENRKQKRLERLTSADVSATLSAPEIKDDVDYFSKHTALPKVMGKLETWLTLVAVVFVIWLIFKRSGRSFTFSSGPKDKKNQDKKDFWDS